MVCAIITGSLGEHTRETIPAGAIYVNTKGGSTYFHAKVVLSRHVRIVTTIAGGRGAMESILGTFSANPT